jgi:hypothetical protein
MPTGTPGVEPKYRNQTLQVDGIASEFETGTCSSDAVEINSLMGIITTESKTTSQNGVETITLTNSKIAADDMVLVTLHNGTNTAGSPVLGVVDKAAGEAVITFHNKHASAVAFDGTLELHFVVIKKVAGL